MGRGKIVYVCSECGYEARKWMGRCPGCGGWTTMVEERINRAVPSGTTGSRPPGEPASLNEVEPHAAMRLPTNIAELDRVLGGGIVPGTVSLVGGDPGIGKSTLLLQAAIRLVSAGCNVLYVTGEESLQQIKMRADRLCSSGTTLLVLAETEYDRIATVIAKYNPRVVIIDSIQTVMKSELGSVPGSVVQIREVTASLVQLAKTREVSFFIVGHVTKEGTLAGPRLLEHMVDCVLYFEGDRYQSFRILRGVKNRFGATNEIGIFSMGQSGLDEVQNPSALFMNQRPLNMAGSTVVPIIEGTRPLLVEIQGLVTPSYFGGAPRRTTTGLDYNRVAIIIAVLEKRTGLQLSNCDIFVNVVGGVKIMEPAADLGVGLSIASSFKDRPLLKQMMMVGEIGLTGEIRPVNRIEERLKEGAKMGFSCCLLPQGNICGNNISHIKGLEKDLKLKGVSTLAEAIELAIA